MHSPVSYRAFEAPDAEGVNAVALAAFSQYQHDYNDWQTRQSGFANAAALAQIGETIVAKQDGKVVGAVTYIAPDPALAIPRADYFDGSWAIMRMLVVHPAARGQGIGHALARACVTRAKRDGVEILALHTSTMMVVAQPMYLRMGFKLVKPVAPIGGAPYGLYTLCLSSFTPTESEV